jgi:hypothetical protein
MNLLSRSRPTCVAAPQQIPRAARRACLRRTVTTTLLDRRILLPASDESIRAVFQRLSLGLPRGGAFPTSLPPRPSGPSPNGEGACRKVEREKRVEARATTALAVRVAAGEPHARQFASKQDAAAFVSDLHSNRVGPFAVDCFSFVVDPSRAIKTVRFSEILLHGPMYAAPIIDTDNHGRRTRESFCDAMHVNANARGATYRETASWST